MLAWMLLAAPNAATVVVPTGDRPEAEEASAPPRLRTGLVLGLSLGAGIGRASGYPNDANDIGKLDYAATGLVGGTNGGLLLMGAIADYLNFGFWFTHANFRGGSQRAQDTGLGLRLEAFPFVDGARGLAGLGFLAQFGVGMGSLATPGLPNASGTQSYAGAGVFYEWAFGRFLGGHFGAGPSLEYDAVFSRSFDVSSAFASVRIVFYGGP